MPRLGFNIDHVATVRNARGGAHPDPVRAAHVVVEAGADSITAHLREDRRHIRDGDIARLKAELRCPLNLEIGATPEMVGIACAVKPHAVCLVPERREERTTEGGLDVVPHLSMLRLMVSELRDAGTRVSLFIEPDVMALAAAVEIGAPVVELHTGAWCEARAAGESAGAEKEFARIIKAVERGVQLGLEIHAGHGLDYESAEIISALPGVTELNIGHFLVGDAIFDGLPEVVARMRAAMARGYHRRHSGEGRSPA